MANPILIVRHAHRELLIPPSPKEKPRPRLPVRKISCLSIPTTLQPLQRWSTSPVWRS
jgi:hypothetical protein